MYKNLKNQFGNNTIKLALTYLAIIMAMSLFFSFILYNTSVSQLRKPLPGGRSAERGKQFNNRQISEPAFSDEAKELLNERFDEAKEELLFRLVLINIIIFASGSIFSLYLARKTLEPIESAMESQSRFVSDASHELRTPLTVIRTTNEVALRKKNISDSDARTILRQNIAEVERLNELSDSLLDLLKNQNKNIPLLPVNIRDAIQEAVEIVQPKSANRNTRIIDKTSDMVVISDFNSVVRIVSILLDNAIKYSPKASEVVISSIRKDGKYQILVSDKGYGIKESDIPHIFDRFYRSDYSRNNNEEIDGYGLGLPIAQQTAENINAEITVKSTTGKGSTFSIVFSV